MSPPLDTLKGQYALLARTVDNAVARIRSGAQSDEEGLVLQGTYLFGVRAFETFLENQIIHLCGAATSWGPKTIDGRLMRFKRRIKESRPGRVRSLMLMGRNYADFLPIDETIKKATVFFMMGRPFSLLSSEHKELIRRSHVVRNLIAHESQHSIEQFRKVVLARYSLRTDQQNAGGYIIHEKIKGLPMIKQDMAGLYDIASFLS